MQQNENPAWRHRSPAGGTFIKLNAAPVKQICKQECSLHSDQSWAGLICLFGRQAACTGLRLQSQVTCEAKKRESRAQKKSGYCYNGHGLHSFCFVIIGRGSDEEIWSRCCPQFLILVCA